MSRDVPFKESKICDTCGKPGAYDFMGDYICPECLEADDAATADLTPSYSPGQGGTP